MQRQVFRVALLLMLPVFESGAQQLSTTSDPPPGEAAIGQSADGVVAWGQSFVALGSSLSSFGFYLRGPWRGSGAYVTNIFSWNGSTVSGNPIFSSSVFAASSITTFGWQDFASGGTALTVGASYFAMFLGSIGPNGLESRFGIQGNDPYVDGKGYFAESVLPVGATSKELQGADWKTVKQLSPTSSEIDFGFRATFSSTIVPEPSTFPLLLIGVVGIAGTIPARRSRARRQYASQ